MKTKSPKIQKTTTRDSETRYGGRIRTFSGNYFWPLDPRIEEVRSEDIAHALSLKTRWTGHCSEFYSVGLHSLRVAAVSKFLAKRNKLNPGLLYAYGLVHDNAEYALADLPTPIKPFIMGWKEIEDRLENVILEHYCLPPMTPEIKAVVKQADRVLLKIESIELFGRAVDKDWPAEEKIKVTKGMIKHAKHNYTTMQEVETALYSALLEIYPF